MAQLGYRDLYREIVLARTDYILRTHLVHEKANRSDAHNTLGLERAVLLMTNHDRNRPIRLTQCCIQFKSPGDKFFVYFICIIMWHSHLNDMEIPETKRFIPKGFELGTTLS